MTDGTEKMDARRMETLAQIARGIAPAFSDLLTVIRGQAGRLLDQADGDLAGQEPLLKIHAAAEKAGSLLRELQLFSGLQTAHTEVVELNGFLDESAGVLRRLLGESIALEFRLAPKLPLIVADPAMLEQWLVILALNARDAMPAGGRLLVETAVVEITPDAARAGLDGRPGTFVTIKVTDTGAGIAPEILPRICEPFFTTKDGGRHVGLGLAAAYGIVKQHQGWMTVESIPDAGASFTALLPIAPAGDVIAAARGAPADDNGGKTTILVVEDDEAVRDFITSLLKEQGYRVLQAGSGLDAMEAWKWHGSRIRLLLTDIVLEGAMNGLDLAARLREENPTLKVICTSGHSRQDMKRFPNLQGGCLFLQKPCRPQTLLADIRTLLESSGT